MAQRNFKFRLEALLAHREQIEKEKQRKVGEIQQEIHAVVRQLQDAQGKITAENRTLSANELVGTLDMAYIAHGKKYVGNLHMKIVLGMQRIAAMEKTLAAARVELLAAARQRKVLDTLKQKQLARWRAEQDRKEAAAMDEIGTQLALRQTTESRELEAALQAIERSNP